MVKDELIQEIQKKRANIAVIGMGYVGLPLAITFANAGFSVTGIDPNQDLARMLLAGLLQKIRIRQGGRSDNRKAGPRG